MKIIHLIYTNGIAGAEKYLHHLLPGLHNKGIECHLVLLCSAPARKKLEVFCEELKSAGVPVKMIVSRKTGFLLAALKVVKYAGKHRIRYIHSHLLNSDIIATLAGYISPKLRIISTKHGYSEKILKQVPFVNRIRDLKETTSRDLYYHVTKWVVKRAYRNYAVSRAISVMYQELGLCRYSMPHIHHGLNVPAVQAERKNNSIVIVGRLEEFKGHRYLFEALSEVVKFFPDLRLTVIGEGSERSSLKELASLLGIEKNVEFLGFTPDPYSHVAAATVVAIPSLFEPFGLVYLEAMALKSPIIAFDTAAGNEILDQETALLAMPANSASLAGCLLKLLREPGLRDILAGKAYRKYMDQFTTEKMVENTYEFYSKELYNPS